MRKQTGAARKRNRFGVGWRGRLQEGFTLAEVMVAMAVFGILATGLATLMTTLIVTNDFARDITEATTLGENKLEEFRNWDLSSIQTGSDDAAPGYTRSWIVEEDIPYPGMKQIKMNVSWKDSKEREHAVHLMTILN